MGFCKDCILTPKQCCPIGFLDGRHILLSDVLRREIVGCTDKFVARRDCQPVPESEPERTCRTCNRGDASKGPAEGCRDLKDIAKHIGCYGGEKGKQSDWIPRLPAEPKPTPAPDDDEYTPVGCRPCFHSDRCMPLDRYNGCTDGNMFTPRAPAEPKPTREQVIEKATEIADATVICDLIAIIREVEAERDIAVGFPLALIQLATGVR